MMHDAYDFPMFDFPYRQKGGEDDETYFIE
jgi:hypothetical protein